MECGAGLGLVLILRWYWWRINVWSEITATIVPFLTYGVIFYLRHHTASMMVTYPDHASALKALETLQPQLFLPYSFFWIVGITTVSWLLVTFLTKPVESAHLDRFFERVQPGGWWAPVENRLRLNLIRPKLGWYALCWLISVVFTYSFLFFSGKLIFAFYMEALIYGTIALVSLFLFLRVAKKSGLFD